ncbi:DNA polymerase III subunit delta [Paenibacillus larvae]|nr:DNA polymerase III subunit delta [Paenibacillus larvae]AQR77409.1 DNA polymerase III subunit delta [Paenibacillus larvae subsp. larvae]ARF67187.1 DNA polymerase III subunit delta [Paenibacillus larvae subsp. pulvifaciens]AVF21573.1 DNA polymerase III subunit delta-like protein [Paenibacillus larvae subsp. larvae]AVG12906.1 DNA polymerase III subunit delta-like protein [Paenibacillus larvae subsp. larvae DSM 25430]ETK30363.1 DNA polymerase III subunit delta-like protein [Paenibacillus larvae
MDYKDALKQIGKGDFAPVYLCYGTEPYLIDQFIGKLTEALIDPDQREFAVSKFDLTETPVQDIIADAETLPFMAPRKLVYVQRSALFTAAKENNKLDHDLDKLTAYMKAPVDYTVLVFRVDAEKLDERKKIVKLVKQNGVIVPCAPLSVDHLQAWIKKQATEAKFTFSPEAVEQLIVYTDGHLQSISKEIAKLSLYVGKGGTVTGELIDQMVPRTAEQNVFMLVEHVVQKRMNKAFDLLEDLIRQKEEPIKLVMLIARQYRIMLQVKALSKQGYSHQQTASQIGLHPYAVKIADQQGKTYSEEQLSQVISALADLDYQMKTGQVDKTMGLHFFLLKQAAGF